MKDDCYGTCPKCGEMGWCHYKGKARIFKSGPGSDTCKVSLFKCGNCGKKFGFELEKDVLKMKNKERDDNDDWEEVYDLLGAVIDNTHVPNGYIVSAYAIAGKHCRCNS